MAKLGVGGKLDYGLPIHQNLIMRFSRITGLTLLTVAFFLFCFGVSSFFWPTAPGTIINVTNTLTIIDQTPTGVPETKHSRPANTIVKRTLITYTYTVGNSTYTNERISLFSRHTRYTERLQQPIKGDTVRVKYLPLYNGFSVLEPGLPLAAILIMSLVGLALFQINRVKSWFIIVLIGQNK